MSSPDPVPPFVWVPGDHVPNMQELHQTMVAVDAATGVVLDPQPDYPVLEDPDIEIAKQNAAAQKATPTPTKSV